MPCSSPSIVASTVLTQTGNLAGTTVYTPSSDGFYRVSVASYGGSSTVVYLYFSASVQTPIMKYTGGYPLADTGLNPYPTYWPSGTPIQISASDSSGSPYSVYVVVEQLA